VLIPAPSFSPDHIHPILVNFTAALVPVSFGSDILGRAFRRQSLHDAGWWTLLYAAIVTPFTAIAGYLWKRSMGSGLTGEMITTHQWLGISLAVAFVILTLWRWSIYSRKELPGAPYLIIMLIVVLGLVYQGTLGGAMVFGA
jgi:uncharacterized membrane protein